MKTPRLTADAWPNQRRLRPRVFPSALLACLVLAGCDPAGGSAGEARQERAADAGAAGQETTRGQPRLVEGGRLVRSAEVRVGGVPITVEIADTDELRARGLMHRDSLLENHGMLFVWPGEGIRSFWMRNTKLPLDAAFIDRNGVLLNIEHMEPQTDQSYASDGPAMYALEMRLGWFEENGVTPGQRLEF